MQNPRYALVAYVRNAVGEFVENLRQELHPDLPHLPAHLTILPPRRLPGSELSALEAVEDICSKAEPFEVILADVETFLPVTPTVFIRVAHGAHRMRELHDRLNTHALASPEEWPYIPHLTVAKISSDQLAQQAYIFARDRWALFAGSRHVPLSGLTFVREEEQDRWVDLAGITLGRSLLKR